MDLALQADLNGQIWFIPGTGFGTCSVGIDATAKASQQQPIYYPPAVSAYTDADSNAVDLYAFGSGTVYEQSANVTGPCVGCPAPTGSLIACPSSCSGTYYTPSIYLVVKPQSTTAASSTEILQIKINALYVPEDLTNHSPRTRPTRPPAPSRATGS